MLDPEQVVRLQRTGNPDGAFRFEVVVDVQKDIDVVSNRITHYLDLFRGMPYHVRVGALVVALAVTALRDSPRGLARPQDVGFERRVSCRRDFLRRGRHCGPIL